MADRTLSACLAEIKANHLKFYVYVLARPCGEPFYVGIGASRSSGAQRIETHEREAARPETRRTNKHKRNTIRKILATGNHILYSIDSWHYWIFEATEREVALIRKIGRSDLGLGPLTNLTNGGEGANLPTTAHRKKLSEWMTSLNQDPEFAAKRNAKIAMVNSDPSLRAKRDAASKAANSTPQAKRRAKKNLAKALSPAGIAEATRRIQALNADPEFHKMCRATRRETMIRLQGDPEFRRRRAEGNAKRAGSKEWAEKCRQAQLRLHADPVVSLLKINKASESMKVRWTDTEYRSMIMAARPPLSEESRKKKSEFMRKLWSDPVYRGKVLESRKVRLSLRSASVDQ